MGVLLAACCVGAFEASVLWKDDYVPYVPQMIAAGENTAFIRTGSDIFVVDVRDPAAPKLVEKIVMGVERWGDEAIVMSGSLLYVAGHDGGLTIYNVSDQSSVVERLGVWVDKDRSLFAEIHFMEVVGTTVYLMGRTAPYVRVVDAADPTAPTLIWSCDVHKLNGQYYDRTALAVVGPSTYVGVQWLAGGSNYRFGVLELQQNTTNCSYVAMHDTYHYVYSMAASDGLLYLATYESVEIVRAEDFTTVGKYYLPSGGFNLLLLSSPLLYVTSNTALLTLNVSDPSSPSLVGTYDRVPTALALVDTTLYEVRGGTPLLNIFDVSTPEAPKLIGQYGTTQPAYSVHVTDTFAVVCYKGYVPEKFIRLYDVSNPSAPTLLSLLSLTLAAPNKAFIHGTYVYVATNMGLTIVDITNPSAPFVASNISSHGWPFLDVKVEGQTAYVLQSISQDGVLYIFDVSNQSAPKQVGYFDTTLSTASTSSVAVAGTVAYLGTHKLLTVDVSSPASPKLLGSVDLHEPSFDMCVQGTVAYLASDLQWFQTVDVSDPTAPTLLGHYQFPRDPQKPTSYYSSFRSVSVVGDIVQVADIHAGLYIFDVSYPTNPVPLDVVELDHQATSVHAVGTTVFVVAGGLRIMGTHTPTATTTDTLITPTHTTTSTLLTATVTRTHTATGTLLTATVTPTHTATGTLTATSTPTHTTTDSVTATVTVTVTATASMTRSVTGTATLTATGTPTHTTTGSATHTTTDTLIKATITPTHTATGTLKIATVTPTDTTTDSVAHTTTGTLMKATGTPTHTTTGTQIKATVTPTHTTTDCVTRTATGTLLVATVTPTHTTDSVKGTDSATDTVTHTHTGSMTVTATMTEGADGTGSSGVPFWVWVLVSVVVLGVGGAVGVAMVKLHSPKRTRAATLFEGPECEDDAGVTEGLVQGGELQDFELELSLPFGVAVAS